MSRRARLRRALSFTRASQFIALYEAIAARDGKRFLVAVETQKTIPSPIQVVLDWTAGLHPSQKKEGSRQQAVCNRKLAANRE